MKEYIATNQNWWKKYENWGNEKEPIKRKIKAAMKNGKLIGNETVNTLTNSIKKNKKPIIEVLKYLAIGYGAIIITVLISLIIGTIISILMAMELIKTI